MFHPMGDNAKTKRRQRCPGCGLFAGLHYLQAAPRLYGRGTPEAWSAQGYTGMRPGHQRKSPWPGQAHFCNPPAHPACHGSARKAGLRRRWKGNASTFALRPRSRAVEGAWVSKVDFNTQHAAGTFVIVTNRKCQLYQGGHITALRDTRRPALKQYRSS